MIKIKFTDEDTAKKGYSIILRAGTVVYTDEKRVYIIDGTSAGQLIDNNVHFDILKIV